VTRTVAATALAAPTVAGKASGTSVPTVARSTTSTRSAAATGSTGPASAAVRGDVRERQTKDAQA
jgi:hypothetical protein